MGGHVVSCKSNPKYAEYKKITRKNLVDDRIKRLDVINKCKNCNTDTLNPKFCSSRCAVIFNNRNRPKITSICIQCGKISIGWKASHKYCSKKCESIYRWSGKETEEKMKLGLLSPGASKRYMHTKYKNCSICNIGLEWNGKPLVLQVDHIDGNSDNNRLENLRLICPNCHTQTPTFCQRNHKNTKRNSYLRRYKKKVLYMQ